MFGIEFIPGRRKTTQQFRLLLRPGVEVVLVERIWRHVHPRQFSETRAAWKVRTERIRNRGKLPPTGGSLNHGARRLDIAADLGHEISPAGSLGRGGGQDDRRYLAARGDGARRARARPRAVGGEI